MPNVRANYTSLAAGELDPALLGREDLSFYDRAAADLHNFFPDPSGLGSPRGGFTDAGLNYRTQLTEVTGTGSTPGGTVPRQIDLGSPTAVSAADIIDVIYTGELIDGYWVEYSDDAVTWTQFEGRCDFGSNGEARSRRQACDPGETVTARYWRVYQTPTAAGLFTSLADFDLWVENGTESAVAGFEFSYSSDADYAIFATDQNMDIYSAGVRVASVKIPHTSAQLATISDTQSLDTLLLFHGDVAPWRVFRQGLDAEWDWRTQAWEQVPDVDFGDKTYTNGTNEVQEIYFDGMTSGVERFTLQVGEELSGVITYSSTSATMISNIDTALEALDDVGSGGVTVTNIGTDNYSIQFTGALAGQRAWPLMASKLINPGTGDEVLQLTRTQEGKEGGEAIMSSVRGWPSCGTFYQGRTILGGFRDRPSSLLFSVVGDFFNLDTRIDQADGAFELRMDSDQVKRIRRLFPARHLQIFTDDAEFYIADRSISKTGAISATLATRRGIAEGFDVFELDGATLFVQEGGEAVRQFLFADSEQNYRADSVSLLSSHLMVSPVSWARVRGSQTNGPDRVWMARADGSAVVLTAMPSQQINAWHPVATDGLVKAFAVEGRSTVYAAIKRTIDGSPAYRIEIYDRDALYDGQKTVVLGAPASSAAGFDHLEGETIELWIDGHPGGTAVVASGSVALPFDGTTIKAGLGYDWRYTTLPLRAEGLGGSVMNRMKRLFSAVLSVTGAGAVQVAANGTGARTVPLRSYGPGGLGATDDDLFTGERRVEGLLGWSTAGQVTVSQPYRAPFSLRALLVNARI